MPMMKNVERNLQFWLESLTILEVINILMIMQWLKGEVLMELSII